MFLQAQELVVPVHQFLPKHLEHDSNLKDKSNISVSRCIFWQPSST